MIRCLAIHSSYVCAHAGACCRAGWPIPVEDVLIEPLRTYGFRVNEDRLVPAGPHGRCVFFEAESDGLCAIHRRAGPALLPSVCRHFPRVVVIDPRGASITLSHYCPTAAAMLFSGGRLEIVEAPASLALDGIGVLEGLDARDVLPPLLAPGILTDWDGYSAWEAAAVAVFARADAPDRALRRLEAATDLVCAWRPGSTSLASAVQDAFARARVPGAGADASRWNGHERSVNAFLAAHAFASWAAYDTDGLRAIPRAVSRALEVLEDEARGRAPLTRASLIDAFRAADWRLRHGVRPGSDEGQTGVRPGSDPSSAGPDPSGAARMQ
jgi:hypothetical protein